MPQIPSQPDVKAFAASRAHKPLPMVIISGKTLTPEQANFVKIAVNRLDHWVKAEAYDLLGPSAPLLVDTARGIRDLFGEWPAEPL